MGSTSKLAHMWTSKYAPRSYPDLITSEQTNREVIDWLDACQRLHRGEFKNWADKGQGQQAAGTKLDEKMVYRPWGATWVSTKADTRDNDDPHNWIPRVSLLHG